MKNSGKYIKNDEEDEIKNGDNKIKVPKNIELISENYFNKFMKGDDYGFKKVSTYIKQGIMLMVKDGEENIIFNCKLENQGENFDLDFDISIEGVFILDEKENFDKLKKQIEGCSSIVEFFNY